MAKIGLKNLHYALVTKNESTCYATDIPKRLSPGISVDVEPEVETSELYGDDVVQAKNTVVKKIKLTLNTTDIPLAMQAELLGHNIVNGRIVKKTGDMAPWISLGYEGLIDNGKRERAWLFLGKFEPGKSSDKTKGEKIEYNTPTITGTFYGRALDEAYHTVAREDALGITQDGFDKFFEQVDPSADATAPTVNIVPAANATGVAVGSGVTFTFDREVMENSINAANITVFKSSDGTSVAGTISLDATGKIVTLKPTTALAANTEYTVIVTTGVKSLWGKAIAGAKVSKFTTA